MYRSVQQVKLAIFPNQHYAQRDWLSLTKNIDGHPQLIIEQTGSNARLHHTAWKRSISVDFVRYGIASQTNGY